MWRLVLVLAALAAGCTVPVQHGLDESSADEVVTALERAGVGADKAREEGGATGDVAFVVRVARGDVTRATEVLRTLGLPRARRTGLAEMYRQPSLVPTSTEERARFIEALGNDLERTLETIDGVVSARVHIVLAEVDPLAVDGKPRAPAQAAVLLKARAGVGAPLERADVQRLVAGSVPGLTPDAVAVVVTPAHDQPAAALAALGPVRLAQGSRTLVVGTFVALGLLVVALAAALIVTARRLALVQRTAGEQRGLRGS